MNDEEIKELKEIKAAKIQFVLDQSFEKAAKMRDKEVTFILEHANINVTYKTYEIVGNEIILNK
jgi:hypothetical protein